MPESTSLTFLGTSNFLAAAGYWNSFVINRRLLIETSPTVLPNLQRAGIDPAALDVIFISHFHADHTFGWPFLLLASFVLLPRTTELCVVGPPGIEAFLDNMVRAGALDHLVRRARERTGGFPLRFVEVDGAEQQTGGVRFRAVRVEHDPALDCYGYLIECGGRVVGYSGDTRPCAGLTTIAAGADILVLECNQRHGPSPIHMSLDDVRSLQRQFPDLPLVLTHRGADVAGDGLTNVLVPNDLETLTL